MQIIQRISNLSTDYKSFNKVQITQRSSNHSTKYTPFNVLYKSFTIVEIILILHKLIKVVHIIQLCANPSTLWKYFNNSIFIKIFVKHTVSSNTKARLKQTDLDNTICAALQMQLA